MSFKEDDIGIYLAGLAIFIFVVGHGLNFYFCTR
ncbi:hypothetical protein [Caudoviricetes sp.]|nr:hypothetical protein [Caudoviricetes sp.]